MKIVAYKGLTVWHGVEGRIVRGALAKRSMWQGLGWLEEDFGRRGMVKPISRMVPYRMAPWRWWWDPSSLLGPLLFKMSLEVVYDYYLFL